MAIDNISGRLPSKPTNPKSPLQATARETNTPASVSTKINTPMTDRLKAAIASVTEAPVNSERIASLKQAIGDGTYKVNPERVAKKIIQFEQALLK